MRGPLGTPGRPSNWIIRHISVRGRSLSQRPLSCRLWTVVDRGRFLIFLPSRTTYISSVLNKANYTSRPCAVAHLGDRRLSYLARPVADRRQSNIRRDAAAPPLSLSPRRRRVIRPPPVAALVRAFTKYLCRRLLLCTV